MSISGLVITLSEDPAEARAATEALSADPRLQLGDVFGRRLALVAETEDAVGDRELWDDLRATPGVVHVDVAFVHLSHAEPDSGHEPGDAAIPAENSHANR